MSQTDLVKDAQIRELQTQRSFLGDRAANLAGDLAIAHHQLQAARTRITELEEQLKEKTDATDET